MHAYIYTYYIDMCIYRERKRDRDTHTHIYIYLELQVREISMFFIFEGFSGFSVNFRVLTLSVNFHFPAQAFVRRALRQ